MRFKRYLFWFNALLASGATMNLLGFSPLPWKAFAAIALVELAIAVIGVLYVLALVVIAEILDMRL